MMRALCLAAALMGAPAASASDAPTAQRWGLMQGLMAGVVITHAVQPLAVAAGELEWRDKYLVSIAGAGLYSTALVGHCLEQRWSLAIAMGGPALGLTAVLTGWALSSSGAIEASIRPDVFQIAGGTLQVAGVLVASQLWSRTRAAAPLGAWVAPQSAGLWLRF